MRINIETFKKGDKLKIVDLGDEVDTAHFEALNVKIGNIVIFDYYMKIYKTTRSIVLGKSERNPHIRYGDYCFDKNCFKKV